MRIGITIPQLKLPPEAYTSELSIGCSVENRPQNGLHPAACKKLSAHDST
jgi:hypothetical protein